MFIWISIAGKWAFLLQIRISRFWSIIPICVFCQCMQTLELGTIYIYAYIPWYNYIYIHIYICVCACVTCMIFMSIFHPHQKLPSWNATSDSWPPPQGPCSCGYPAWLRLGYSWPATSSLAEDSHGPRNGMGMDGLNHLKGRVVEHCPLKTGVF